MRTRSDMPPMTWRKRLITLALIALMLLVCGGISVALLLAVLPIVGL